MYFQQVFGKCPYLADPNTKQITCINQSILSSDAIGIAQLYAIYVKMSHMSIVKLLQLKKTRF